MKKKDVINDLSVTETRGERNSYLFFVNQIFVYFNIKVHAFCILNIKG